MRLEDIPLKNCPFCGSKMYVEYSYYAGVYWLKHAEEKRCIMHTMDSISLDKDRPKQSAQKLKLWNERAENATDKPKD